MVTSQANYRVRQAKLLYTDCSVEALQQRAAEVGEYSIRLLSRREPAKYAGFSCAEGADAAACATAFVQRRRGAAAPVGMAYHADRKHLPPNSAQGVNCG